METGDTGSKLELDNVGVVREGKTVLRGISYSTRVTRLGLVGRNGSGKSTLARLLAGLTEPTTGRIRVNGTDIARDRKAALREVGILFQNPDHQLIFPTVLEEMAFGLQQSGQGKPEAEESARRVLSDFGKAHWEGAYVNTLSQGQKHLLCFMSVTAMAPRLLILDEPFAGLDIPTKAQLRRYLDRYVGNTIHITHDPADLDGYDDVVWIDRGQIRRAGQAQQVLTEYVTCMTELGDADDIAQLAS